MSKQVRYLSLCGAAIVTSVMAQPMLAADDLGFSTTPTRVLANSAVVNASVTAQGSETGDIRQNTFFNSPSWVNRSPSLFDEQIINTASHTGSQSFAINNWYNSGVVPSISTPWLSAPAGETGTKDVGGTGVTATSNVFNATFWVRSAATSDPNPGSTTLTNYSQLSTGADDGAGTRWGGVMVMRDRATTNGGSTFGSGVQIAWDNESTITGSNLVYSPVLNYAQWYKVVMQETFVNGLNIDGSANDIVSLQVFDANNNLIWSPTGLTSWEASGFYGPSPTPVAANSMQWRLSANPDTGGGPLDNYSTFQPAGFYFDDYSISTGAGLSYSTSFEIPEPTSLMLAVGALLPIVLRRRRHA